MTLNDIRSEIERAEDRRHELWRSLSEAHDAAVAAELASLERRLDGLWNDYRALRARLRFGEPAAIARRARLEERLERAA
jgi:hypothetical protein